MTEQFQNKNKPFCNKIEERHNTSLKYISKEQDREVLLAVSKQAFTTLKAETKEEEQIQKKK